MYRKKAAYIHQMVAKSTPQKIFLQFTGESLITVRGQKRRDCYNKTTAIPKQTWSLVAREAMHPDADGWSCRVVRGAAALRRGGRPDRGLDRC